MKPSLLPTRFCGINNKYINMLTEIPGPTIRNTSPATKKEDFKYSTPIEGPDNQFGSADRSDDEDERDSVDELSSRTPNLSKIENTTKNKTHSYLSTNMLSEQKISNKIRKIFELDNLNVSNSYKLGVPYKIVMIALCLIYFNNNFICLRFT